MKVGLTLSDDLMKRVDECADKNYMSRSGLVSYALNQYLNSLEMVEYMRELTLLMKKIADKGELDHETIEQLEDLERVALLFGRASA